MPVTWLSLICIVMLLSTEDTYVKDFDNCCDLPKIAKYIRVLLFCIVMVLFNDTYANGSAIMLLTICIVILLLLLLNIVILIRSTEDSYTNGFIIIIHPIHEFKWSDWLKRGHMTWISFDSVFYHFP